MQHLEVKAGGPHVENEEHYLFIQSRDTLIRFAASAAQRFLHVGWHSLIKQGSHPQTAGDFKKRITN
jgi:hypothetical protein